ncbi:MAG: hypothetical protein M1828_007593 [Chrysothrix sp. TS-e1954]|nr:MAG: hypothetical protein M1828_007593 [Chrysothrix sp. TS-e1954]
MTPAPTTTELLHAHGHGRARDYANKILELATSDRNYADSASASFAKSYVPIQYLTAGSDGLVWICARKDASKSARDTELLLAKFSYESLRPEVLAMQNAPDHSLFLRPVDFEAERYRWLVMPFVKGTDLTDFQWQMVVKLATRLPTSFVFHILIEMAAGLATLHDADMCHLDGVEQNVYLDAEHPSFRDYPGVYCVDFGKAAIGEEVHPTAGFAGPHGILAADEAYEIESAFKGEDACILGDTLHYIHHSNEVCEIPKSRTHRLLYCQCKNSLQLQNHPAEGLLWLVNSLTRTDFDWPGIEKARKLEFIKQHIVPRAEQLRELMYQPLPERWAEAGWASLGLNDAKIADAFEQCGKRTFRCYDPRGYNVRAVAEPEDQ